MKTRILSTIFTVVSITGAALAQRGVNTHVVTMVRDDTGRPVQGASVRFFGPFGSSFRRADYASSTDRSGISDQTVMEGRYLVYAFTDNFGSAISTYDANDRSGVNRLDMRLRPTRRPTIQVVLMSEDRNEPIGGANIEIFTDGIRRRDNIRSNSNGITPYDIPGSTRGGRFDLVISSRDFETVTKSLNFRPRSDTGTILYYVQMRRKNGFEQRDGSDRRGKYTLDGMIRTSNKDREEVGGLVTINVGLLYAGGRADPTRGHSVVTIKRPDGSTILDQSSNIDLPLNEYANRNYDIRPNMAGTYTVSVRAEGEDRSSWNGRYSFVVHPRSRGNGDRSDSDENVTRGDFVGNADIETDDRLIESHILSITLSDGNRNNDNVKGWLAPRRGDGFHMSFKGSYDYNRGRLDAVGTMVDRTDKRWDIRLTGSPDRNGRIQARLSVRATDNSYDKTFSFTISKQ